MTKCSCSTGRTGGLFLWVVFTLDGKQVVTARDRTVLCWDFALLRDTQSRFHHDGLTSVSLASCRIFEVNEHKVRAFSFDEDIKSD